jgi:hypothetical protein
MKNLRHLFSRSKPPQPPTSGRHVSADGREFWLNAEGKLHRDDGPAVEYGDGSKAWYRNGTFHREDGPAYESADGTKVWCRNGRVHRDGGPACISPDGYEAWYQDHKLHRDDGPALVRPDGNNEWWRNGVRIPPPSRPPRGFIL